MGNFINRKWSKRYESIEPNYKKLTGKVYYIFEIITNIENLSIDVK